MNCASSHILASDPLVEARGASPQDLLHVVLSLDTGGLEHVVLMLCRQSAKAGRRVAVACLQHDGALAGQLRDEGIEVFDLEKRPGVDWSLGRRFSQLCREWGPSVIHTHQIGALFYAGPAAKQCNDLPVIHSEHGKHYDSGLKLRMLARYATRFCDRYVGVAPEVRDHALRRRIVSRHKARVVVNGIDVDRFSSAHGGQRVREDLGIALSTPVVGSVGRLAAVKNYSLLLRAFSRLAGPLSDAHLILVGDGPERGRLESEASRLGIASRMSIVGFREDREDYLAAMNVFCLSSDSEGLPLSLLEAMAARVPVVASQVGGIPAVVREGETGALFPPGDEQAAAARIECALTSASQASHLASQAFSQVMANYSSVAMHSAYEALYRELLSERTA